MMNESQISLLELVLIAQRNLFIVVVVVVVVVW